MAPERTRTDVPQRLYAWIVAVLGATLVIGVVGWFVLVADGRQMPDSLGTILSTIAGGLVGALTMGGSSRDDGRS